MTTTTTAPVGESLPMVRRADGVPGPAQGCWTYDAYAALPDDGNRYEVIAGVLYLMPGPTTPHQQSVTWFVIHLGNHVQVGGLGRVFTAPYDVLLPGVANPVQPDIVVVLTARLGIITRRGIEGVPDLVVEISSPGTAGHDRRTKQDAYAKAGIPEYWLADPAARVIEVLVLDGGAYRSAGLFEGAVRLPSTVLPELPTTIEQFFA